MKDGWKKQFLNMDTGVSKITIAGTVSQNCIQKNANPYSPNLLDEQLNRILNVKTIGSEVLENLKPNMQAFEKMTPLEYQAQLSQLIQHLQQMKMQEKRQIVHSLYQEAIRVLQNESVSADLLEEFRIMLLQG